MKEWNAGEEMTREAAEAALKHIGLMFNRLYYQPHMQAFGGREDYEAVMNMIEGLTEYVRRKDE
ncbi:MAG: hypothetical protein LUD03_01610 [Firmicutes bacterium]|nr:hypothetical protein [Bacillota bacterium]